MNEIALKPSYYLSYAYLLKYYPEHYNYMIDKMKASEKKVSEQLQKPFTIRYNYSVEYVDNIVRTKWIKKLEHLENNQQLSLFDYKIKKEDNK